MLDYFAKLYPSRPITERTLLNKLKVYSIIRILVRYTANFILPYYFDVNNFFTKKHRLKNSSKAELIVTFTSFPARIDKVWLVVETIFRQMYKPDKLVLWLSKEQFTTLEVLPKKLLKQRERGLEIRLVDSDLRSYKKYFYTLKNYPESDWIIIDDDVFYPSDLVKNLVNYHLMYPDKVVFNRGSQLTYNKGLLQPYKKWKALSDELVLGLDIFATGVGGVYYPKGSLHEDALNDKAFQKYCPLADDVWLYVMARRKGTEFLKTTKNELLLPVINKEDITLSSQNVLKGRNDHQINSVRKYLQSKNEDVF